MTDSDLVSNTPVPSSPFPVPRSLTDKIFGLLDLVFPGIPLHEARRGAEEFGAPWESASTPFVRFEEGRVVSHVGLLEIPLMVAGRPLVVGGVHGVATHPDRRRRGYFRQLIEELFRSASDRYSTFVLTTVHPEYFTDFGFRVVPESVFVTPCSLPRTEPITRSLDLRTAPDRESMHRLIDQRVPVSETLGIGPEKCVWAFYEAGSDLRYSSELDLVIVAERVGGTLRLYDIIGPAIPPLDRVIAAVGGGVDRVITYFSPDRLGAPFEPRPHDLAGGGDSLEPGIPNTCFMVRGPFEVERPLMLPRAGRC